VCSTAQFHAFYYLVPPCFFTRDSFLPHNNSHHHIPQNNWTVSDYKQVATLHHPLLAIFVSPHYFLFTKVQFNLNGATFDTVEEIQKAVTNS
jgi:hypothetical protein